MKRYKQGDIVSYITCPSCGQMTPIKVNKNGMLYIYCTNKTGDINCMCRMSWGIVASHTVLKGEIKRDKIINTLFGGLYEPRKPEYTGKKYNRGEFRDVDNGGNVADITSGLF